MVDMQKLEKKKQDGLSNGKDQKTLKRILTNASPPKMRVTKG